MSPLTTDSQTLYEVDYLQWLETTVEKLRSQEYSTVDWGNLIEEIEDIGRSERRTLERNLIVIILYLLKWHFQPDNRSGSWEGSIIEHRHRVKKLLNESPSLKPYLESIFVESYIEAVKQAKAETRQPLNTFPIECPYTLANVIDDEFLPE